jgi:hypothetical protein
VYNHNQKRDNYKLKLKKRPKKLFCCEFNKKKHT